MHHDQIVAFLIQIVSVIKTVGCMYPKPKVSFSRRFFLRGLLGSAALSRFPRFTAALPTPVYAFEEVPPSVSGITWVHTAGKSPMKYFPETTGAGCAFLDYDNDGRSRQWLWHGRRSRRL